MKLASFSNFLVEAESNAHKKASELGLQYKGFGHYHDARTGKITHKTENGELVPIQGSPIMPDAGGPGDPDALKDRTSRVDDPTKVKPTPGAGVGPAPEPGEEQNPGGANWHPGPQGDHCVGDQEPPDDMSFDMFVGKTNYYKWTAGKDGTNFANMKDQAATNQQQKEELSFDKFIKEEGGEGLPAPRGADPKSNSEKLQQQGFQHQGFNNYRRGDGMSAKIIGGEIVYYSANGEVSTEDQGGLKMIGAKPTWSDPVTGMAMTPPAQPETPEEISAVPSATPAQAPAGYDKFLNKKQDEARINKQINDEISEKMIEIDNIYAQHPLSRVFKMRMDGMIADAQQSSEPQELIFAANLQDVVNEFSDTFNDVIQNVDDEKLQMKMIAALSKSASDEAMERSMQDAVTESKLSYGIFVTEVMDNSKVPPQHRDDAQDSKPLVKKPLVKKAISAVAQPSVAPNPMVGRLDNKMQSVANKALGAAAEKKGMSLQDFQQSRRPKTGKDRQAAWDANIDPKNQPGVDPQEFERQQKSVSDADPTDKALDKTSPEATELSDILDKKKSAKKLAFAQQLQNVVQDTSSVGRQEKASAVAMMHYLKNSAVNLSGGDDELFQKIKAIYPDVAEGDKKDWYDSFVGQGLALRKNLGLEDDDIDDDWAVERTANRSKLDFLDDEDQQDFMQHTWDRLGDDVRKKYGSQLDSFNPADLTFARKSQLETMKKGMDKIIGEFGDNPDMIPGLVNTYMDQLEKAGHLHRASLKQGDTEKGVEVQGKPVNQGKMKGFDIDYDEDGSPRLFDGGFLEGQNPRTSLGIKSDAQGRLGFDSHSFLMSPFFKTGDKEDRYSIENKVSSLMGDAVESRELPESEPENVPWRNIKGGPSPANARGGGIPVQELGSLISKMTGEDINYRLGVKQKTKKDGSPAAGFEPDKFNDDDKKYWGDMIQSLMDEKDDDDNPFFNFGDGPSFNGEKMGAHDWTSRVLDMANNGVDGDSKHETKFTNGLRSKLRQFRLMQMMQKAKGGNKGDLPKLLARLKYMAKKQGVDGDLDKGGYTLYQ